MQGGQYGYPDIKFIRRVGEVYAAILRQPLFRNIQPGLDFNLIDYRRVFVFGQVIPFNHQAIDSDAYTASVFIDLQVDIAAFQPPRSEEHTSELQSLMRSSYAVFFLKTKKHT